MLSHLSVALTGIFKHIGALSRSVGSPASLRDAAAYITHPQPPHDGALLFASQLNPDCMGRNSTSGRQATSLQAQGSPESPHVQLQRLLSDASHQQRAHGVGHDRPWQPFQQQASNSEGAEQLETLMFAALALHRQQAARAYAAAAERPEDTMVPQSTPPSPSHSLPPHSAELGLDAAPLLQISPSIAASPQRWFLLPHEAATALRRGIDLALAAPARSTGARTASCTPQPATRHTSAGGGAGTPTGSKGPAIGLSRGDTLARALSAATGEGAATDMGASVRAEVSDAPWRAGSEPHAQWRIPAANYKRNVHEGAIRAGSDRYLRNTSLAGRLALWDAYEYKAAGVANQAWTGDNNAEMPIGAWREATVQVRGGCVRGILRLGSASAMQL